jgi:acyl-CoA synthetase (AMP-forming)/AMP-acid ligase II
VRNISGATRYRKQKITPNQDNAVFRHANFLRRFPRNGQHRGLRYKTLGMGVSIDTPVVMWGTLWAGGTISPANPGYTVDELAFQLR